MLNLNTKESETIVLTSEYRVAYDSGSMILECFITDLMSRRKWYEVYELATAMCQQL